MEDMLKMDIKPGDSDTENNLPGTFDQSKSNADNNDPTGIIGSTLGGRFNTGSIIVHTEPGVGGRGPGKTEQQSGFVAYAGAILGTIGSGAGAVGVGASGVGSGFAGVAGITTVAAGAAATGGVAAAGAAGLGVGTFFSWAANGISKLTTGKDIPEHISDSVNDVESDAETKKEGDEARKEGAKRKAEKEKQQKEEAQKEKEEKDDEDKTPNPNDTGSRVTFSEANFQAAVAIAKASTENYGEPQYTPKLSKEQMENLLEGEARSTMNTLVQFAENDENGSLGGVRGGLPVANPLDDAGGNPECMDDPCGYNQ
jgi:hypothetical protein